MLLVSRSQNVLGLLGYASLHYTFLLLRRCNGLKIINVSLSIINLFVSWPYAFMQRLVSSVVELAKVNSLSDVSLVLDVGVHHACKFFVLHLLHANWV